MNASSVFLLLLVLACPLMMMWMMRGGHRHGHGSHDRSGHDRNADHAHQPPPRGTSVEGLRELRTEIDRMIEERESAEWAYSEADYSDRGYSEREPEAEPTAAAKR